MKIITNIFKTLNFILIAWILMSLINTAFNIKSVHKPKETNEARATLFTIAFITPIILIDKARDKKKEKEYKNFEADMIDRMAKAVEKANRINADPEAYYASDEYKEDLKKYEEGKIKDQQRENRYDIAQHFPELAEKFKIKTRI